MGQSVQGEVFFQMSPESGGKIVHLTETGTSLLPHPLKDLATSVGWFTYVFQHGRDIVRSLGEQGSGHGHGILFFWRMIKFPLFIVWVDRLYN